MINKQEFKKIFDNYFDAIRSFIFYRCGDTDVASDMAQDVFMKIWEKRDKLDRDNVKSLLYKMANNMVVDSYRKNNTRANYEQNMIIEYDTTMQPDEELYYQELVERYANTLEEMPMTQRVVFLMSRNDEMKYSEIANRLSISIKAVEKRMSAALLFLRSKLL